MKNDEVLIYSLSMTSRSNVSL